MKKKLLFTGLIVAALVVVLFIQAKPKPLARELKYANRSLSFADNFDSAYYADLKAAGFTSIENVKALSYITERKKWMREYGLYFLGDAEMSQFLSDNDFIIGPASRYIEDVPKEAGLKMIENFNKIYSVSMNAPNRYKLYTRNNEWILDESEFIRPPSENFCNDPSTATAYVYPEIIMQKGIEITPFFCIERQSVETGVQIQIIAAAKCFNTVGMVIEDRVLKAVPPKDPIAVVKVKDGWVELANW